MSWPADPKSAGASSRVLESNNKSHKSYFPKEVFQSYEIMQFVNFLVLGKYYSNFKTVNVFKLISK